MPPLSVMTDWPPWAAMWTLAAAIFMFCKGVSWLPQRRTAPWRQVAYFTLWPGLDAQAFLDPGPLPSDQRASFGEWIFAFAKVALGAALVWGMAPLVPLEYMQAWVGMAGLAFLLHFGSFHVLSCAWRALGVNARPLMDWPVLADSVSDFWSKRWNLAFRDLTHRFLFRPLVARGFARGGLLAVFVFSGVVHDAVISLPAGGGYGLPTAYFTLQALALFCERSRFGKRIGLGKGVIGRLFTAIVVLGPASALFHPWFARNVIVPFLAVIGAT